ncbi:MAG: hypothetical protein ACI9FN_001406 [Saprospiraceae bacterium]|jgi:hypothetical protein
MNWGYRYAAFVLILCFGTIWISADTTTNQDDTLDYSNDIRPILNKHCLKCHGGVKQQGGLSFLFREAALDTTESGIRAIVPGDLEHSEMIHRISSDDPDLMMPPEGDRLSSKEVEKLKRWIEEGAEWSKHWAYQSIREEVNVPKSNSNWGNNEIDAFVKEAAKSKGLQVTEEAEPAALLRRVSFDLIGLPPSEEIVQKHLSKNNTLSYERVVDQLLESEHYGERWAAMWMDLARYADSQGYQKDKLRPTMWAYRDWVINAFNQNMPFDQFTIEQLAGDLLEAPDKQQLLATAFHRNTMTNDEGGTDDEEYRVAAVMDRVNTTYEIWQATTISCVQCHSHPYDPIRHDEYYKLYATFNNTWDRDHPKDLPLATLVSAPMQRKQREVQSALDEMRVEGDTLSNMYKHLLSEYMITMPIAVPVMEELKGDEVRQTRVFERGNWLVHGAEVNPSAPQHITDTDVPEINSRLELANWLVSEENPLTARVIVNRLWEQIFGLGLVETVEDFGTQGIAPSHPELLDWLAYRLMHTHKWHLKPLLKDIVMSSTYRQSSHITDATLQKDAANKWLARGPRIRLSAEQLRDQALDVSGLLNHEVYGPSVMPHQPEGVWNTIRNVARWKTSSNGNNHRRGLYTLWRRVSPYPSMMTFDTPSRELCVSRRIRTNTPLQALVTLNDPVYVEAAEALTWNVINSEGLENQITKAYQRVLMKEPDTYELEILMNLYKENIDYLSKKEANSNPCKNQDIAHQSLFNVVSTIMNLDEVIMKG